MRGATTVELTVELTVEPSVEPSVELTVVLTVEPIVTEAAAGTGVIRTLGATARETAVTEATATETTVAMDDATGATATIDSVETTVLEGDDEMEEAGAETGEETSARSRPRQSQSSASPRQTLRPSPTSRTASAV